MMKRVVLLSLMIGMGVLATAQKVVDVCGEYTYYASEDVTPKEARRIAEQRARIEALIKEFNETVYQNNTSVVSNRNGESTSDFYSFGGSDARGEWIEDTKSPEYDISYDQDVLVVTARVCGKAREIVSAGVTVEAKVLRNGLTPKYESSEFKSGDDMYVWFRSPVSGYVLVYLLDQTSQTVYCLLPYRNSEQGNVKVKGDQDYVFFYRDKKIENWQEIDEYTLFSESGIEFNDIYIIFSPHPFSKASSTASEDKTVPKELPLKQFDKWLLNCRNKDPEMVVEKRFVKITKAD